MAKKVALIGLGVVGRGFLEAFRTLKPQGVELNGIAVRNPLLKREEKVVFDSEALIDASDIVVEAITDHVASYHFAVRTLKQGKIYISASKKMLAQHLKTLQEIERSFDGTLLYEASSMGAVPIVQSIDHYFSNDRIESMRGILNGTSNFILSEIFSRRSTYTKALQLAQEKGYAEANPHSDVSGEDSRAKLILLVERAWGIQLDPKQIPTFGIQNLTENDIRFARDQWKRIRLVAAAEWSEQGWSARVMPELVGGSDPLYAIEDEKNGILIKTKYAEENLLIGKGAGSKPTGMAMLNDVLMALEGRTYRHHTESMKHEALSQELVEVYIRYHRLDLRKILPLESVTEGFIDGDFKYLIGTIRVVNLIAFEEVLASDNTTVLFLSGARGHHHWSRPADKKRAIVL